MVSVPGSFSNRRLLLGSAVDATAARGKGIDVDLHHIVLGEQSFKDLSGGCVGVGVAELGAMTPPLHT